MMDFSPVTVEQQKQFDQEGYLIVRQAIEEETIV